MERLRAQPTDTPESSPGISVMTPEAAAIFTAHCHKNLAADGEILDYWKQVRHLTDATINEWQLGAYTPTSENLTALWHALAPHEDDIHQVLRLRDGHFESDFFNNRAIVPIHDTYGNVVAFSGRTLLSEADQKKHGIVKYRNTKYQKTNNLFGLHKAIPTAIMTGQLVICEGNIDVITAHQHGIKNVVGAGSSNVSPAQLALAARYANTIVIALDADSAGDAGAARVRARCGAAASELGIDVQFLRLDGAKDIDSLLQKERKW